MGQQIFADLHNHTTASDGDFTPDKLVGQAAAKGIKAIGITDHDTLNGLKSGLEAGRKYDIEVVPGVEASICFKRSNFSGTLHLLCYFPEKRLLDNLFVEELNSILAQGRGEKLVKARIKEINRFFGPGRGEPLLKRDMQYKDIAAASSNPTRRHFAIILKEIFNISDSSIINKIIGNDSRAYVPSGIQLSQFADFMQKSSIFTVLAHPAAGSYPEKGHYKEVLPPFETVEIILPEFLDAGVKGIEINYPGHTGHYREILTSLALKYKLIVTGGSDCHDEKNRPMGIEGISKSEFEEFKKGLT